MIVLPATFPGVNSRGELPRSKLIPPVSGESNPWATMFEQLIAYKKVHGNCNVPQKSYEDKRLGKWVNTQRTRFKRGKPTPDRQRQLESIGFVWNLPASRAVVR
jgi:hypothetical protein